MTHSTLGTLVAHTRRSDGTTVTGRIQDAHDDPVAALAARLQPVPALVYELLYAEHRADPFMRWFEYGTIADRILVTLADRPDIAVRLRSLLPRPPCERCGASEARPTAVRTAYSWADNGGINPNHPMHLCPPCTEEYNEHWDGMWADYYAGLS
jgi:hypothetical protein